MKTSFRLLTLVLLAAPLASPALAAEVSVAVAANFTAPMQKIAADFEKATGHQAKLAFGATGKFYAQIKNGAPFEVLLAADDETPAKLEKEGARCKRQPLHLRDRQAGAVVGQDRIRRCQGRGAQARRVRASGHRQPQAGALRRSSSRGLDQAGPARQRRKQVRDTARTLPRPTSSSAPATPNWVSSPCRRLYEDGKLKSGSAWIVPASLHNPIRQDAVMLERARTTRPPPRCSNSSTAERRAR